jgi:hypothetical protein
MKTENSVKELKMEKMQCERCACEVQDERDLYEFVDFMVCEECIDMILNGPTEMDEVDELAEELENMHTE